MRHAEEVTFGTSGLDRAAELRGRDEDLRAAHRAPGSVCILIWRGFPLLACDAVLARLPMDHPVLQGRDGDPVLLGREETGLVFARDISEWSPPDAPADLGPGRSQGAALPHHPEIEQGLDFDGVIGASDLIAIGAIRALQSNGRRVPDDVSVVGYDNVPFSRLTRPALSTISQDTQKAGRMLVSKLIDSKGGSRRSERSPTDLIVRASCGA